MLHLQQVQHLQECIVSRHAYYKLLMVEQNEKQTNPCKGRFFSYTRNHHLYIFPKDTDLRCVFIPSPGQAPFPTYPHQAASIMVGTLQPGEKTFKLVVQLKTDKLFISKLYKDCLMHQALSLQRSTPHFDYLSRTI